MIFLAIALAALVVGGVAATIATSPRWSARLGAGGALAGSAFGLVPALQVLAGRELATFEATWSVPGGSLSLAIDPLSAFFLVPLFVVSGAAAVYGYAYLLEEAPPTRIGAAWLWLDLLVASMALVLCARNGLLFLMSWEAMALTSFFLVVFHHEREGVPRAGWIYLTATHLGTAFLLALFGLLAESSGSLDFGQWAAPATGGLGLLALAVLGFGSKAGLLPLHVWLPEAHPVAPSHVSALLSGVMIKLGVYGILRFALIVGAPTAPGATALLGVGLVSGIGGVLLALGQHDLKRLLAYHSVENVGIIVVGIALAWVAADAGRPGAAALALAGGLLHVWNHALFKALLFLGAGSVGHRTGTLDLDELGGLLRRMPWTGSSFLLGAAAISALPPLNGFVSELLIYAGAFDAISTSPAPAALWLPIPGLALIGGLAAACFVKAAGISFLGEPRSAGAEGAREVAPPMVGATAGLALLCVFLGLAGPLGLFAARGVVSCFVPPEPAAAALDGMSRVLWIVGGLGTALLVLVAALAWLRARVLRRRACVLAPTWGCGYGAPSPRMQYTASSFAQPLTDLFAPLLGTTRHTEMIAGEEPAEATQRIDRFASHVRDRATEAFELLFAGVARIARRIRPIQAGNPQLYVLYTLLAAIVLLFWRLG